MKTARLRTWGTALLELASYYLLAYVVVDAAPAGLEGRGLIAYAVVVSLIVARLARLLAAKVTVQ